MICEQDILIMSVRRNTPTPGTTLAVITRGGHPVLNPDQPCEVLMYKSFRTDDECLTWFDAMKIERPWEKRN